MKYAFITVLGIMTIILSVFTVMFKRNRKPYERNIFECFISVIFIMIANIGMAVSKTETWAVLTHLTFFISMGWLCAMFAVYAIRYTTGKTGPVPYVILAFECIDTTLLLVNLFTRFSFFIRESGEFLTFTGNAFFIIHLALCYSMLAIGYVYFIIGSIREPGIYKLKYVYILITVTVGVLLDAIYLYFDSVLNWSVLSFALICIGSYYFMFRFVPDKLQDKTIRYVADNLKAGVLAFDKENDVIYMNDYFIDYFHMCTIKADNELILQWTGGKKLSELENFEGNFQYNREHYKLQFHRFETRNHTYLGSFFTVTDVTSEMSRIETEHYKATHDALTNLYTREFFYTEAERFRKEHPGKKYTILVSDIGNFKFLNELFGTASADFILKKFGEFLLEKTDYSEDVFGRLDTDNFVLMIPSERFNEEYFLDVTRQIMNTLDKTLADFFICYIGVYDLNENIPIRSMCDRAMLSLKQIKGTTKRISYYKKEMSDDILLEQELSGELSEAIKNHDIKLFVQPQTDKTGHILGGECLVRWQHPKKGLISPGIFVPMFERNGRITDIDLFIWEEACQILASWKNTALKDYYLSVNISAKDLITLDITKTFQNLTNKYGVDPKLLKLEITESAAMNSVSETEAMIGRLHEAGFIVEMDDFGSGYSSLNTLKDLSFDTLKLDMAFLRDAEDNEKSRKIIRTMISLARELDMDVITEGVEKKEHVDFLDSVGCPHFQGYYFYKPMPWTEYEKKIENQEIK